MNTNFMKDAKLAILLCLIIHAALSSSFVKAEVDPVTLDQMVKLLRLSAGAEIRAIFNQNQQIEVYGSSGNMIDKFADCEPVDFELTEKLNAGTSQNQPQNFHIIIHCKTGQTKSLSLPPQPQPPIPKLPESRLLLSSNSSNSTNSTCGNGIQQSGEQCDDGNIISGDGCSQTCTKQYCGDGIVSTGEQCDDGNTVGGDGCSSTCMFQCGNGIIQGSQECDDSNRNDGDGCSSTCKREQTSTAVPLAVGIPLGVLALVGVSGAIFAITKGSAAAAAGANYISQQPARIIEIEQSTKIVRPGQFL